MLAFDAEDIVQWLEASPAVATWFGRIAGVVPTGVRDLEGALEDYRLATQPEFDPSGTLIGRKAQVESLLSVLLGAPTAIQLQTSTQEEGEAFIGSSINTLPFDQQEALLARCLCIADAEALRQVCAMGRNFILIIGEDVSPLPADARLHTVIRVVRLAAGGDGAIELVAPNMRELIEWVHGQDIDRNEAFHLCYDADGNLERVRKNFLRAGPPLPQWAKPPVAQRVAAAALLGAWESRIAADQATVRTIASEPYDQFEGVVAVWMQGASPLMMRAGDLWRVHSRSNALRYLEPYLRTAHLEAFTRAFIEVVLEPDPRFDLLPNERWLSPNKREHSDAIREALVETMLLLAAHGDVKTVALKAGFLKFWVDRALAELYKHREEANFWRRLRSNLAELAEASPDQFLSAIEADLGSAHPQILDLLRMRGTMEIACMQVFLGLGAPLLAAHILR
ncbi:hypothetical protein AWV79_27205 [Cupriavidus sp. UYMMa02A]|nr:hypothetical protein AWV79_27205 [Cupriavidus sp. UYMMa02A]